MPAIHENKESRIKSLPSQQELASWATMVIEQRSFPIGS
jgi:hypothetical protein